MRAIILLTISNIFMTIAWCGIGLAACEEQQYSVERTQKVLAKEQATLNNAPDSRQAQEKKRAAWVDWEKAREELRACIQKDADSSWQQKPYTGNS